MTAEVRECGGCEDPENAPHASDCAKAILEEAKVSA